MRDVRHDNLAQFMGACVDNPNICILFQDCPKGSLQVIYLTPLKTKEVSSICTTRPECVRMRATNCQKLQLRTVVSAWRKDRNIVDTVPSCTPAANVEFVLNLSQTNVSRCDCFKMVYIIQNLDGS